MKNLKRQIYKHMRVQVYEHVQNPAYVKFREQISAQISLLIYRRVRDQVWGNVSNWVGLNEEP